MLHQPLPQYLNKLNQDDDALRAFLADPIKEADAANLSKAERAVLRRVVTTGSNGSVNGYSIVKRKRWPRPIGLAVDEPLGSEGWLGNHQLVCHKICSFC